MIRFRKAAVIFTTAVLLIFCVTENIRGEEKSGNISSSGEIIFLLDTSASMNAQDRDREAIDAIRQAVYSLPSDYRVGLVAYNTDIQTVIVPGTPAAQMEEKAPEGEIQEETLPPSPLPVRVFKPRTALASLLLAVLLVGVGVLIGLNLPRKEKLDLGEQVMIKDLPPAQLERTPTDIEDELNWLETTVKGLLEEEPSP